MDTKEAEVNAAAEGDVKQEAMRAALQKQRTGIGFALGAARQQAFANLAESKDRAADTENGHREGSSRKWWI